MTLFPANSHQMKIQILRILKDGKPWEKNEVLSILAKHFKLKMSEYTRKDPNSKRNSWDKRVTWEISWLRKRGFIKNIRLGHFHITPCGRNALDLCG